jgi:endonuclease IV
MPNPISVSTAPIAKLGNKRYYDLTGTLEVMKKVFQRSAVDGFELQLEPEWDSENPPLTDPELADWTRTPKYTTKEILALVRKEKLPILSVHASRDIGNYLCSNQKRHIEKGERGIHDSLFLATELDANVCVFHLWDTRKTEFNIDHLEKTLSEIATEYPQVKASVENIPTHLKGQTPFSLVKSFKNITLDLRWAALYDELNAFKSITDRIANIHLRGTLKGKNGF